MTSVLENADFCDDLSHDGAAVYRFKDRVTGEIIDCVWSPTNEEKVINDFSMSVGDSEYAYLTVPSQYAEGTTKNLEIIDGNITVDVTETPVYITYSASEKNVVNGKGYYIRPVDICLSENKETEICDLSAAPSDATLNQFYRMFDEPDTMPEFIYSNTSLLSKPDTNVNRSDITCYV